MRADKARRTQVRVGLISDTHGLLRDSALDFLRGSDFIIHAGDVGKPEILTPLEALAPLTAVRGNNDKGAWADRLAETEMLRVADVHIYVIHDLAELDIDLEAAGVDVVVSGHSHRPAIAEKNGVLFINPGSAGPRRFRLPIGAGEILVSGKKKMTPRLVEIERARASDSVGGLLDRRVRLHRPQ